MRHHDRNVSFVFLVLSFAIVSGCALPTGILKSRWAMDDPEYAEKYADGADKSDVLGKIKQASDARFLDNATGWFVSTGVTRRAGAEHGMFTIDLGGEAYLTSYLTSRLSLVGMANSDDWFTGLDTGLRLQTPTRLAPFVGIGASAGFASERVNAENDLKDNDDDGSIDELGEKDWRLDGSLATFYPEVGAHFWWTPEIRLSTYGRYMMTTEGRDSDDWLVGGGIAFFSNPLFAN